MPHFTLQLLDLPLWGFPLHSRLPLDSSGEDIQAEIFFLWSTVVSGAAISRVAPELALCLRTEDDYEPVNRWWEREDGAESGKRGAKKWDTFEHHGCPSSHRDVRFLGLSVSYCWVGSLPQKQQQEWHNFWCRTFVVFPQGRRAIVSSSLNL